MTVTCEACIVFCILWSVSLNFWSLMVFTSSLTANWQWKTPVCKTRQEETRTLFIPHTEKKTLKMTRVLMRHCQGGGGGPLSPVWILKRLVWVFINACSLLLALPSLSQFGRRRMSLVVISFYALSLLFGPCRLSEFTLAGPHLCKVQAT